METLEIVVIYIILCVVWVTIISIKERENVFTNLAEFFMEWLEVLKTIVPGLIIIVILLWALGN